jgi:hypothetical protein
LAQLVARFHGMEEVRGSSPLSSTIEPLVRPPFVIAVEAFWLVGLALLTNLLTNVRVQFRLMLDSKTDGGC